MAIQGVPRGNRSRVYGRMVDLMQTNPVLSLIFPTKTAWSVSNGKLFDPEKAGMHAHVYMVPRPFSTSWYGPDSMSGVLQVDVYFWLPQNNLGVYDAFDAMDVWEVVEQVFYPLDDTPDRKKQFAVRDSLKACGAKTGLVMFSQPATQNQAPGIGLVSYGQLQIDVVRRVSP